MLGHFCGFNTPGAATVEALLLEPTRSRSFPFLNTRWQLHCLVQNAAPHPPTFFSSSLTYLHKYFATMFSLASTVLTQEFGGPQDGDKDCIWSKQNAGLFTFTFYLCFLVTQLPLSNFPCYLFKSFSPHLTHLTVETSSIQKLSQIL